MDFEELQYLWQQYDKKLFDNNLVIKEILRKMLRSNSRKRLNWMKLKAGFNLIAPIIFLLIIVPRVEFRNEIGFYVGLLIFVSLLTASYSWAIRYYLLIGRIDFRNPITEIKKDLLSIEKFKIKITRGGYILSPFALIATFLTFNIPVLTKNSILPVILVFVVFIISIYVTFKYSIPGQFRKLNLELEDIERLEKE